MDNKLFLIINVEIKPSLTVSGKNQSVNMIPFSAFSDGPYFCGKTLIDGVDVQTQTENGFMLSARYMLDGTDADGRNRRVYIENEGSFEKGFTPHITTDCPALSELENVPLKAEVQPNDNGVIIKIFRA